MPKHLIHIGFPKTGSTFLQEWFSQHPQICYSHGALAGFRSIYDVVRLASKSEVREFVCYVTSNEGISIPPAESGEVPVSRGKDQIESLGFIINAQNNCCKILKEVYPNSKVLIVTRGLKQILFSGFSQYVKSGGIYSLNELFARSIQGGVDKMVVDIKGRFDINNLVEIYSQAFGKDNILIIPYELLRDNKRKFLSVIENEMGLNKFDGNIPRLNESLSPEELYWYPHISKVVSRFAQLFGQKGYQKIYRRYVNNTMKNKFDWLIKILSRFKPEQKIIESDLPVEIFENCRDFATIVKDNPLYKPYLSEYLLDQ